MGFGAKQTSLSPFSLADGLTCQKEPWQHLCDFVNPKQEDQHAAGIQEVVAVAVATSSCPAQSRALLSWQVCVMRCGQLNMTDTELSRSQLAEGERQVQPPPQGVLTAPRAEAREWLSIHAKG